MDVLAALDVGTSAVFLRRARPGDVAAIVGLLAADQLGTARDGVRTAAAALGSAMRNVAWLHGQT